MLSVEVMEIFGDCVFVVDYLDISHKARLVLPDKTSYTSAASDLLDLRVLSYSYDFSEQDPNSRRT